MDPRLHEREEDGGEARSPALSLYSMTARTVSSLGGGGGTNDDASESSASSVGRSTTSSNHTGGNLSLVRRAQEFDQLLQSQGNVLGDFDSTPAATDIEDDELESELQDLARSESMLRKELEIFATSFRHVGGGGTAGGANVVDDDEEDTSTLPDLDDPAMLQEASSTTTTPMAWSQTPLSDVTTATTPGMAPWSPPISPPDFLDQPQHAPAGARVSLEESDLQPPDIETQQLQPSRLAGGPQLTPQWQRGGATTTTGTQRTTGDSSPETDDDDENNVLGGIMPMGLTGSNSSSPLRRPQFLGSSLRPARVSLEEEVPSLLNNMTPTTSVPTSVTSPSRHGALGPPTQRPSPILEGGDTASEYSNDSSLFADLTRLSSTTPRISNTGGNLPLGSSLSSPASSSRAPSLPSLTVETGPTETRRTDYDWNEPPSPLTPSYGQAPFDDASPVFVAHSPDVVEDDLLGLDTSYSNRRQEPSQAQQEQMDAHVGLLQPWTASAWKQPDDDAVPMLYPTTALSPIMSVGYDDEDMASPTSQGENGDEGRSSVFSFPFLPGRKRRQGSPFLRMNTSTEEEDFTRQRRRRPCRGLFCLVLLVFCVVCAIVVPTSIAVARSRNGTSSSIVGGGDSSDGTDSPSGPTVSPRPSLRPTRSPSLGPSVSTAPSGSPSESPSSPPTISSRPSFSMQPSSEPTLTAHPTTAQPTDAPSEAPTTSPSASPSSTPSTFPTVSPSAGPTGRTSDPTIGPTHQPTAIPSPLLTVVPTLRPTFSPSVTPTPLPSAIPTTAPPTPLVLDETLLSFLRLISFDGGAALDDPTSPQYSAFLWLSQDPNLADFENERRTQRYAMATLYYSLNGESWLRNDGWLSEDDECTWFSQISRQICGPRRLQSGRPSRHPGSGSMIRLVLYYNNLEGVIPPEIALLTHLEEIHLMGGPTNYISGSIPSELGYLVNLRDVQLADNRLTGVLPSTLEAWHEIQYLDLSKNALSGSLTNEVVGGWFELTELHLSSNRFTGPMPLTWAQSLVFLELDNNILTGPLPASMGNLPELRLLSLDYNRFTSLPSDLVSLIVLEDFSIVGNELAGPLMPELGFLPQLRSLRLSNNTLTSTIPTEFGELARLISVLDLSNNELEGAIPSELGQINDRLRSLRLAGNRLSGPLPASLASLNRLAEIRLEDNDLTGAVPSEVCDVWYEELPTVYADCGEIDCPCCNFCCIDGEGCLCRYADDPELAWRCY